jgi:hypothetical protein
MEKLNAISTWIKSNPLIVFAGAIAAALATMSSLIGSVGNVVPATLKILDLPDCYSYANIYRSAHSFFRMDGEGVWREYPPDGGTVLYEFKEVHRTREYIDLLNLTERPGMPDWRAMLVRLPACGGKSEISIGIPERWSNLFQVWPE